MGVAWILFFPLAQVLIGTDIVANSPLVVSLTFIGTGIAIAAFVTGLISVVRRNERSSLVFVAIAIGLYGSLGVIPLIISLITS